LDEALRLAQGATEKLPKVANVMDTLGWIYYKKAAYASAVDTLKDCVGKFPQHAVCQYHLAMSYSKIGDIKNARAALAQGLKLNPAAPEAGEAKTLLANLSR
jgi:predicted Zn-dependent protease